MRIKEIIVVEGRDDTTAIQRAVDADTIETNGSAINEATLEQIQHAFEKRGVIIFTDPDYPGEKIRKTIEARVPGCKHAFLPREEARSHNGRKVGVEHASDEAIRTALALVSEPSEQPIEQIPFALLVELGLIAGGKAKQRREQLGKRLRIGHMNGKQLYKRLLMFQITLEQFEQQVAEIIREEQQNDA